jgi:uncharacterized caspase-like protein
VSKDDIRSAVEGIAGKVVVFLDTCYAGATLTADQRRGPVEINGFVNEFLSTRHGIVVFSSSNGHQQSLEHPPSKHGAFTKALLDGLSGKADFFPKDSIITVDELSFFIRTEVKQLTDGRQSPVTSAPPGLMDFKLAGLGS